MLAGLPAAPISPKRDILCSRENALRVASRIFYAQTRPVSIIRTCDPLQPFRVSTSPGRDENVVVEMVS
ncbi:hypothetical protein [Sphingobium sp. CECT 9361]|uniref:hypothetical protein n=1 Tax=Sphingobium sp. CECT 9361 TaxID=2845384 RepID=UPI001E417394|nr:hypothetical protein [Sphingobium sp. CECT 9361]CAH0356293.1 hypothetical protein SPH9361_03980 [Sphingobium sp. CECT 9361]